MSSDPPRRPRVLQVITHLALGGAERVAFNLIEGLKEHFDFGVYAANGIDPGEVGQSMRRELEALKTPLFLGTNVPIKFGGMVLAGMWMGRAVRQYRPDVIHLHTEIPESSYASMVAMRPSLGKIPIVRTIHNSIYWTPWRKLGRWCDKKMPRSYVAAVGKGAQEAFEQLRSESAAGPVPQPPVLVYNGVVVKEPPRPMGKPPGEVVRILFAGRFEDQKGADLIPQIIQRIQLNGSRRCELIIHGSGSHEMPLRELAEHAPPGWSIQISGPVAGLSSRMPGFDLMIMPSRYEGLALGAIEAALLQLPIIATDGPGIREGFPQGYPWLARAGDPGDFARLLQDALDNPDAWGPIVQQAKDYAQQHFNLAAMCDAYAQLYTQAIQGG